MSRTFIDDIEDSLKEISPYPWSSIVVDPKTNKAVITKADCGQNITYWTIIENIKPKDRKFIAEAPSRIASLIRYIRQLEGK